MDFNSALKYPFKGQNLPKILTIVLVFVILGVSVIVGAFALESVWIVFLFAPLLIAYALFLGGYVISVIGSVMDGENAMPEFAVGTAIGRGFMVLLASFVYYIPFFVIFGCIFGIASAGTADAFDDNVGGMFLLFCGGGLIALIAAFVINYALTVGQIRYAAEGRAGALFDVGTNFGIVMSNMGKTFSLLFHQIGLGIVFGISSYAASMVIQVVFTGALRDMMYINDVEDLVELGMPLAIFFSLYYIITMTINLMQAFAGAHVIAGYGTELGLGTAKSKNDDEYTF